MLVLSLCFCVTATYAREPYTHVTKFGKGVSVVYDDKGCEFGQHCTVRLYGKEVVALSAKKENGSDLKFWFDPACRIIVVSNNDEAHVVSADNGKILKSWLPRKGLTGHKKWTITCKTNNGRADVKILQDKKVINLFSCMRKNGRVYEIKKVVVEKEVLM